MPSLKLHDWGHEVQTGEKLVSTKDLGIHSKLPQTPVRNGTLPQQLIALVHSHVLVFADAIGYVQTGLN